MPGATPVVASTSPPGPTTLALQTNRSSPNRPDWFADTQTIWFGEQGSPAYYKGSFSDDGDTLTGAWVYPGGGGYSTTTTRVK